MKNLFCWVALVLVVSAGGMALAQTAPSPAPATSDPLSAAPVAADALPTTSSVAVDAATVPPVGTSTAATTASAPALAPAGPDDVVLPAPRQEGGMPLRQALHERQSEREFASDSLPLQHLSDLLWAAAGVSRPESGKRTIPSAKNWQMVEVVAILPDGAYLYDAKANILRRLAKGDLRPLAGKQAFVASAPLNLVYVSDPLKLPIEVPEEDRILYGAVETGCIVQNVYLFCASEGLATVVRASVDRPVLAMALQLPLTHRITLVQTVGKRP